MHMRNVQTHVVPVPDCTSYEMIYIELQKYAKYIQRQKDNVEGIWWSSGTGGLFSLLFAAQLRSLGFEFKEGVKDTQ